jgi:hypothetical protein
LGDVGRENDNIKLDMKVGVDSIRIRKETSGDFCGHSNVPVLIILY